MDFKEIQNAFPIGTPVIIKTDLAKGPLSLLGMKGCVVAHDPVSEICVEVFFSQIFQPCFWFGWSVLKADTALEAFTPVPAELIEQELGGRRSMANNMLTLGAMRSWLIDKVRALPDQDIYNYISTMDYQELNGIYRDALDMTLVTWVKEKDTRVKRPRIIRVAAVQDTEAVSRSRAGR